jgi:hypothetical protein
MTAWTIQCCPNIPGGNEDENAFLDDGSGVDLIGGWHKGWDYIAGNAEPGDTVTVLEPDTRTADEVGYEPPPLGWSPFWDPDRDGPLGVGAPPSGWVFDTDKRQWFRTKVTTQ